MPALLLCLALFLTLPSPARATPDTAGYWQQEVAYHIMATLDEASGVLTGRVRITYVNRSAHVLNDFYVHQYLNAFRPGSRWSAADSAEGRERFQHLEDPDHAFERITAATVMGVAGPPDYPYAPDSTIAHWALPRPLPPGDTLVADLEWRARPSTLPRRQGRRGRRFDFAQWYPRVVVYDRLGWQDHPLYPAGEFYGEFATYDVTLGLARDQVIGATGVPVEGDPGWADARAFPAAPVDYQRDWYGPTSPVPPGGDDGRAWGCAALILEEDEKCVRFHAEDVHHFAFSLNPEYRYEEGRYRDVVVRALYLPEDRAAWGSGVATGRTEAALAWLDRLFGPFPWPQLTNLHRIEGGGTEFPMVIMDGSASMGLIVHEVGHNYLMGVLANNEWREGWLDEGFTSFQSAWFFETGGAPPAYPGVEARVLFWDLDAWSQPISTVSERFRDFTTYSSMIYVKGQLFFEQLRYIVGDDTMRRILRAYYARWRLKHVDEGAFRRVAEEVSGLDLGWFFGQWLHGTPLIDYRLDRVRRERLGDGRWQTTVTVSRLGDGWMPLEIGDRERIYARTTGQEVVERLVFTTVEKPGRLSLDPRVVGHDWNMLNNVEPSPWWRPWTVGGTGGEDWTLDNPVRETARRDRRVRAVLPLAWSNDHGGITVALRERANYLGRYDRRRVLLSYAAGQGATDRVGGYVRIEDPLRWRHPRLDTRIAGWSVEGRTGAAVTVGRTVRDRPDGPVRAGLDVLWMATTNLSYLDPRRWDDAGTVEIGPWATAERRSGEAVRRLRVEVRGGVLYWVPGVGIRSGDRYDVEGFLRGTATASARVPGPLATTLGVRLYAGAYVGRSSPPPQRGIPVAGADPYETFTNPLLRSRGAWLVRPGLQYHAPGGANLRAFAPHLAGRWAASVNVEVAKPVWRHAHGPVREVALVGFVDAGVLDTLAVGATVAGRRYAPLYDGGVAIVTQHAVRDLAWTMRLEFPLWVTRPALAADVVRDDRLGFRWQVSLEPSF